MKQADSVREKIYAERQKAHINLDVLLTGIGSTMNNMTWHDADEIRTLLQKVDAELVPALEAVKAADKAYEPYWSRRRVRYIPRRPKKGKKNK